MQLGTENRNKTIAAISLMVLALVIVAVRFFPDSPAAAKSPSPVVTLSQPGTPHGSSTQSRRRQESTASAPTLRLIRLCATTG